MRRFLSIALLGSIAFAGTPLMVGCDDTKHEEKTTQTKSDGTTVTKETKTTESPNGTQTTTEKKDVEKPANP